METERGNIAHINGMCKELAKVGHVDLLKDSAKLNKHWDTTTQALQDRIADIEKGQNEEIFTILLLNHILKYPQPPAHKLIEIELRY